MHSVSGLRDLEMSVSTSEGLGDKNGCSREDESLNMAERHSTQVRVNYGPGLNMAYTHRDGGWR